jgi:hypothetical protein
MKWTLFALPLLSVLGASSAFAAKGPALPMKAPPPKEQAIDNAKAAGVWGKTDTPKVSLRTSKTKLVTTVTITGLVGGGAQGSTAKVRENVWRARFDIHISRAVGEVLDRQGAWKNIEKQRM